MARVQLEFEATGEWNPLGMVAPFLCLLALAGILGEWNQAIGGDSNTGTGTININPGTAAATMRPALVE